METLDKGRIAHLFKLGIISSLLALSADMILGWGVADESLTGLEQYFSRYLTVSDTRIVLSAVIGMIGITIETLCYFGVYRLIASRSAKLAHAYRAGLIGMIAFGPFTHVMCCASIYHLNALNKIDPSKASDGAVQFILCFLLPVTVVFFPFFLTVAIVQFKAFLKNETPYPKFCCIFSILSGLPVVILIKLIGNYPAVYAITTGWISIGSLIAFSGLLINMKKAEM
jgi:hypothetical protein